MMQFWINNNDDNKIIMILIILLKDSQTQWLPNTNNKYIQWKKAMQYGIEKCGIMIIKRKISVFQFTHQILPIKENYF